MKIFITGGAGFIGRNMVPFLLKKGHQVLVYDRYASSNSILQSLTSNANYNAIEADVLDQKTLTKSMRNHDIVYHFSANADVRGGLSRTDLDLTQGTMATSNILNAMRTNGITKIVFPSSMTIYGDVTSGAVSENYGPCLPISLYAANKLGSEALISAFCHSFGIQSWIFRFANVTGPGLTHGVIFDLMNKLQQNSTELKVLGDGTQTKPYIYIDDLIEGIKYVVGKANERVNLFNLGVEDAISVSEIVKIILNKSKFNKTNVLYDKTPHGWVGDVPVFTLNIDKLRSLGFTPQYTSKEAVIKTVEARLKELSSLSS